MQKRTRPQEGETQGKLQFSKSAKIHSELSLVQLPLSSYVHASLILSYPLELQVYCVQLLPSIGLYRSPFLLKGNTLVLCVNYFSVPKRNLLSMTGPEKRYNMMFGPRIITGGQFSPGWLPRAWNFQGPGNFQVLEISRGWEGLSPLEISRT